MFLTICIPTYNREKTLKRTLKSLVVQTDQDFEILVIDDGSEDETYNLIENNFNLSNLKYYRKENGGKHTALNMGIKNAKGQYFMILDSDDFLVPTCVEQLKQIVNSREYKLIQGCIGIIGKSKQIKSKRLIGDKFDKLVLSYIDLHFNNRKNYGDCCECILTSIIRKYSWPEPKETRFVPEAYVFDKIGLKYKLFAVNKVFKYVEYLEDGITYNTLEFKRMNNIGFLYYYVFIIEDVIPKTKISKKKEIVIWWQYWNSVITDKRHKGPRVKQVSKVGYITKIFLPLLNFVKVIGG